MRTRMSNGYRLVFVPEHPRAMRSKNWQGFVYEHILVMEKKLGRRLRKNEVVHHKNERRADNYNKNLELKTRAAHTKEHNDKRFGPLPTCTGCGRTLGSRLRKWHMRCYRIAQRKVRRPTRGQLKNLLLYHSICAIGRAFGVSDNAARKWAKAYGLLV